jgi:hypothetical protein
MRSWSSCVPFSALRLPPPLHCSSFTLLRLSCGRYRRRVPLQSVLLVCLMTVQLQLVAASWTSLTPEKEVTFMNCSSFYRSLRLFGGLYELQFPLSLTSFVWWPLWIAVPSIAHFVCLVAFMNCSSLYRSLRLFGGLSFPERFLPPHL